MIQRQEYLDNLISFKDKELIKVITGIRRCGKSTLFDLYCEYLKSTGISEDRIIRINLENPDFHFATYKELYDYVKDKLVENKMNYVFLDEVQIVPDFERACDGLYIKKNVDLYITGSNAYLLSGELATLLSGRYVEIKMLPLSFKEYVSAFPKEQDMQKLYNDYVFKSSFPYATRLKTSGEIKQYLDGIYDSIFIKDIVTRKNFSDISMLKSVSQFVFDNIGNLTSANKIADTMTSARKKNSSPYCRKLSLCFN